jgi:hypothetical protein
MTANSYFGLAPESVYGVAASPSVWTPIEGPKMVTELTWLDDSAFRGSPVMHYDQTPGVLKAQFDGKVYLYTDIYPNLLRAILGGEDQVTDNGDGTYLHTIGVLNDPTQGSQAPSYTVWNNSVDNTYTMTSARISELTIAVSVDAAVENTFVFMGNAASVGAASVVPNESSSHLVPSWACSASFGGTPVAVIENLEIAIKRNTAPIHTIGQQNPYNNFQGPISVEGKFTFVVENGENFYAEALERYQQALYVTLSDPASNDTVEFLMDSVQLEAPVIDQSKAYVSLTANFVAIANTSDAEYSGYAPIYTYTTNSVSTPY